MLGRPHQYYTVENNRFVVFREIPVFEFSNFKTVIVQHLFKHMDILRCFIQGFLKEHFAGVIQMIELILVIEWRATLVKTNIRADFGIE